MRAQEKFARLTKKFENSNLMNFDKLLLIVIFFFFFLLFLLKKSRTEFNRVRGGGGLSFHQTRYPCLENFRYNCTQMVVLELRQFSPRLDAFTRFPRNLTADVWLPIGKRSKKAKEFWLNCCLLLSQFDSRYRY